MLSAMGCGSFSTFWLIVAPVVLDEEGILGERSQTEWRDWEGTVLDSYGKKLENCDRVGCFWLVMIWSSTALILAKTV